MTTKIKIALLMGASLFMDIMDGTIVTTALPKMAQDFDVSVASTSLLISTYLVAMAIFVPMSGWLAARFGNKRIWLTAVGLFTVSSLGAALAPNFAVLLVMRILQGVAGAMMTPVARLIVLGGIEPHEMLKMISYLIYPALLAPTIAPILGGAIVTYWTWHWIFLINLPIGAVILALGWHMLPKDVAFVARPFDWRGFLELGLASILLLVGADLAANGQQNWLLAGVFVLVGLILAVQVVFHLKRAAHPLFGLESMAIPSFRILIVGGQTVQILVAAMPYLMTLLLQTVFGWSAVVAGWYVLFIFIGNVGIKPVANKIVHALGFKNTLLMALLFVLVSSLLFALVTAQTAGWIIALLAMISGVGRSLALTAYNGVGLSEVAPAQRNSANTLISVSQTLAAGIGISLMTVLLQVLNLWLPVKAAFAGGFIFMGLLMLIPLIEVGLLPKTLGQSALKK
ncbi:MAG TPA: MFS transporter [Lactobacillaceae bacterium]|jgi:EmrB/QacA subfamily drug resistance transporter